jgi:hypothetical protein
LKSCGELTRSCSKVFYPSYQVFIGRGWLILEDVHRSIAVDPENASDSIDKELLDVSNPEKMLLSAAEGLRRSMQYILRQLNSRKVRVETKLKLMRNFTRQAEALAKIAQALHSINSKSAGAADFSKYLSEVMSDVPEEFATAKIARISRVMNRSASCWQRSTMRRRH